MIQHWTELNCIPLVFPRYPCRGGYSTERSNQWSIYPSINNSTNPAAISETPLSTEQTERRERILVSPVIQETYALAKIVRLLQPCLRNTGEWGCSVLATTIRCGYDSGAYYGMH
ncbi:unnamed protein product [Tuber aestivum]|uniref:Uncharacterized protein n=1 Tax=Tuber aestivum TaxID=59557 RepID=A0A292PUJ1_9PEZI|nr:unnamed protein product [Tuber aestivum]